MANLRANNLTGTGGRNAISGSVFFDGSANTFLKCTDSDAWDFGANNFTIEYWFLESDRNRSERRVLFLYDSNAAIILGNTNDNGGQIFFSAHDSSNNLISGSNVLTSSNSLSDNDMNQWMHVAIVRDGSNLKIYLNGILEVTDTGYSTTAIRSDQNNLYIGHDPVSSGREFKGYLSNFRIVKGTAVYTTAFTPPTEKLTAIDGTVLLCCQDSDDPTQEATGKTLTGYGNLNKVTDDVELITNGQFFSDVSGWTVTQGAFQWTAGQAEITSPATTISQNITTVVGKRYRIEGTANDTANTSNNVGMTLGSRQVYLPSDSFRPAAYTFTGYFTATSTTTTAQFWGGTDALSKWSNISVKLAESPKQSSNSLPPVGVDEGVVFEGDTKVNSQGVMYFPTGDTSQRGRGRGVIFGGYSSPNGYEKDIYYIEIQSMGNAVHFGDLTATRYSSGGCASTTRGLSGGGRDSGGNRINTIEYVTIATTSNSLDFGDLTEAKSHGAGCGNQTRGIWMGGTLASGVSDVIEYATIPSTGNATDFGNLRAASTSIAVTSSPTRGLALGGGNPSSFFDYIDYVEIATTGNAADFGDLTQDRNQNTAVSSNTRAICIAGNRSPAISNVMDYVTIATLGDATDFGDTVAPYEHTGSVDNSIRGVICGARTPSYINILESLTIATLGNSRDFGDIPRDNLAYVAGCSDSHGGLS